MEGEMAAADDARRQRLVSYLNATAVMVRSEDTDLTQRQQTVLLKVYLAEDEQTVRGLAAFAGVSKPAITRALDRLSEFDLVRRKTDPTDRRSILVQHTGKGRMYIRRFGELLVNASEHEIQD
jgi:DNA-binding MarR family transcriptional regulator